MNKKIIYLLIAVIIIILAIVGVFIYQNSNKEQQKEIQDTNFNRSYEEISKQETDENNKEKENSKILIAFFSRAGENYSVGVVEKGNTEIMAENIAEITEGNLFEIEPVIPYPNGYEETKEISTREKDNDERPEIKNKVQNFDEYDIIFLGYPIWYGSYPMIINTFLESYDFTGKTVIPFNTHEGSGNSGTYNAIKSKLQNTTVLDGLAIRGSTAREENSKVTIQGWINGLDIINKGENISMNIKLNNVNYSVILDDNITTNEIVSNLPLTLNMTKYAEHEYYSELPFTPVMAENKTSEIKAGHIYYWDGWNAFVINYEDTNISPYKVVHIGEVENKDINAILKNAENNIQIEVGK